MRASDLKPEVEYSTCNGELIVPVEPIHGNWFKVYNADKNEWELVNGQNKPKVSTDPWGGCHKPQKPEQPHRRRTQPGVLVDRYEVDRVGKRIAGTEERVIVLAKDIAGTWKEYLTLYADVVRKRWDDLVAEKMTDAAKEALISHFAEEHGVDRELVSFGYSYREKDHIEIEIRHKVDVPRSRAKNPPSKFVRAAEELGLDFQGDAYARLPG